MRAEYVIIAIIDSTTGTGSRWVNTTTTPGKTLSSTGSCSRCCGDLSSQRRPPRRNCIALSWVARYS